MSVARLPALSVAVTVIVLTPGASCTSVANQSTDAAAVPIDAVPLKPRSFVHATDCTVPSVSAAVPDNVRNNVDAV